MVCTEETAVTYATRVDADFNKLVSKNAAAKFKARHTPLKQC